MSQALTRPMCTKGRLQRLNTALLRRPLTLSSNSNQSRESHQNSFTRTRNIDKCNCFGCTELIVRLLQRLGAASYCGNLGNTSARRKQHKQHTMDDYYLPDEQPSATLPGSKRVTGAKRGRGAWEECDDAEELKEMLEAQVLTLITGFLMLSADHVQKVAN